MGTMEPESNDNSDSPCEDTEDTQKLVQKVTLAEENEIQTEHFILAFDTSWFGYVFLGFFSVIKLNIWFRNVLKDLAISF